MDQSPWRILLVDDDIEEYLIAKNMLAQIARRKITLEWASEYQEGKKFLETNHYDAVLVDYDLGSSTGIELIEELTKERYAAPLILFTGRGSFDVDLEAMQAGATLYLTKAEANPLVLERFIRYAIERKQSETERERLLAESHRQKEALKETNNHLQGLFDHSPAGMVLFEAVPPYRVLTNNRVYQEYFEEPWFSEGMQGHALEEFLPSAREDGIIKIFDAVSQTDQIKTLYNFSIAGFERGETWWNWHLMPVYRHGKVYALAAMAIEVTEQVLARQALEKELEERKRVELELRESEQRFRALADNIPQLAWMADEKGWIFWFSQRWFEYTGTTFSEMEGWGWMKVHHPEHIERVVELYRKCVENGTVWEDIFPLRSKTGEYRWFLSRAQPIRDESGNIVRWFGTNTDITEQREVEERLAYQALLLQNVHDAIIATDEMRRITAWNRAAEQMYGYLEEEVIGKPVAEVLRTDMSEEERRNALKKTQEENYFRAEVVQYNKEGKRIFVEGVSIPIRDKDNKINGYVAANRDITQRKMNEEMLRSYVESLKNSDSEDY